MQSGPSQTLVVVSWCWNMSCTLKKKTRAALLALLFSCIVLKLQDLQVRARSSQRRLPAGPFFPCNISVTDVQLHSITGIVDSTVKLLKIDKNNHRNYDHHLSVDSIPSSSRVESRNVSDSTVVTSLPWSQKTTRSYSDCISQTTSAAASTRHTTVIVICNRMAREVKNSSIFPSFTMNITVVSFHVLSFFHDNPLIIFSVTSEDPVPFLSCSRSSRNLSGFNRIRQVDAVSSWSFLGPLCSLPHSNCRYGIFLRKDLTERNIILIRQKHA